MINPIHNRGEMKLASKTITVFIVFFLLSSYGYSLNISNESIDNYSNKSLIINKAKLIEKDGLKLLYLNGSYYEMGYQHGFLLKKEINENMRAFMEYANKITSYENLLEIWNMTKKYVPSCYLVEMQGIADGSGISFEKAAALYMIVLFIDMKCFTFSAWSNATKDGKLYHVRSLDFPLTIKDPISGKYIQENSVLIIRKPDNGLKSLSPSIAGSFNFYQGVNEKQVSIGVQVCPSEDQTLYGLPVKFKIQKILDTAESAQEAIDILTENRTLGWNFIISDGEIGKGYVIEMTNNHVYVGDWNNPIEDISPFWMIENVVRRTNFFKDPTMASTQRVRYNPSGVLSLISLLKGDIFFPLWRKYRSMSIEIEKNWGNIDLNSSISILRKVYSGKTDFFMFIFLLLMKDTILADFHQWSVCTQTGEFVFSYADDKRNAHENNLYYFNLNDFFE